MILNTTRVPNNHCGEYAAADDEAISVTQQSDAHEEIAASFLSSLLAKIGGTPATLGLSLAPYD